MKSLPNILRRSSVLSLVFLVFAALGVGTWIWWGGQSPTPSQEPEHRPLKTHASVRINHYWDESFSRLRDELAAQGSAFNKKNSSSHLIVDSVRHEAYKTNLLAMLQETTGTELFSCWAGWRTRDLQEHGLLLPLDEWWNQTGQDQAFGLPIRKQACEYNGHIYMLPLVQCHIGFFANVKIFEKTGLQTPKTWNEFLHVCKTLRAQGYNPIALGTSALWPAQFWFDYLLLRTSGSEFRNRLLAGTASYDSPEVRTAFRCWKELLDIEAFNPNPSASDWKDAAKLVHSQGAAMTLMGTWIMDPWKIEGWEAGRDYIWFPFPSIDVSQPDVTLTVIDGLVLGRGTNALQNAKPILDYFASAKVQTALAKASGNFSPNVAVKTEDLGPLRQNIQTSVAPNLAFAYDLSTPPEVERIGLELMAAFLRQPDNIEVLLKDASNRIKQAFERRKK